MSTLSFEAFLTVFTYFEPFLTVFTYFEPKMQGSTFSYDLKLLGTLGTTGDSKRSIYI